MRPNVLAGVIILTFCILHSALGQVLRPPAGHESIVRIRVDDGDGWSYGSGTIIDRKQGTATVLTAAHLLSDRRGKVLVGVTGRLYEARVLQADQTMDLATLEIADPGLRCVVLSEKRLVAGAKGWASGYGSTGYRQVTGRFVQYLSPDAGRSWDWAEFACAARDGDSGGPILDSDGRLVAVVSGTDGRRTCGPCFPRIRAFLGGVGPEGAGQQRGTPPSPQPAPSPPTIDYEKLAALVFARIEANAEKFRGPAGEVGPQGPRGQGGPQGEEGPQGKTGGAGPTPAINYDALAAAVIAKLPPVRVEWERLDGTVLTQEKPLGEPLRFESVKIDARK